MTSPWPPMFGEMELPDGAKDSDPRWQQGYADGEEEKNPATVDPVYVSGWCHGFCGANQTSDVEAVEAYRSRLKPATA